jgi:LmbE family N-acetylglucosaminyl deacetylase
MTRQIQYLVIMFLCSFSLLAQAPRKLSSSDIYHEIEKLNFLGTVLYVAAHPDDENTRMISYFSNQVHARTAYLSITRGDGGQNLIGPEIRELLGVIRTNELLQARKTDGGQQFFTRANDFGYSKHPDETLRIWKKDEVMNDVVRVIREFQPDVIINRFDAGSAGRTHGHHTSSAMLSLEAFDLASDASYTTPGISTWEPRRIFFNTHWWFYGSREKFEEVDKSNLMWVDTGVYYEEQGLSNSEIASLSRSMHKSQGFGSTGTRGSEKEYLELLKGDMPTEKSNVFEGIDTSWSRVKGGEEIQEILDKVQQDFDFKDPSRSVPGLLRAYELISGLENRHWRTFKTEQIKEVIAACLGLYLEGVAAVPNASPGQKINLQLESINRSPVDVTLNSVSVLPNKENIFYVKELADNQTLNEKLTVDLPKDLELTFPYWLDEKWSLGMYRVEDKDLIGEPVTPRQLRLRFSMVIQGMAIDFERDVVYKYNDPVKGEVYQPFEIVPEVSAAVLSDVVLFDNETDKEIPVVVRPHTDGLKGSVSLLAPEGWTVKPGSVKFEAKSRNEEIVIPFVVSPPEEESEGLLRPVVQTGDKTYGKSLVEIDYDHIPKQMVFLPAES